MLKISDNVESEMIGNDLFIMNFDTQKLFSLSGTSIEIFLGIKSGKTKNEIAKDLSTKYNLDINKAICDTENFIDSLLNEGVVISKNDH